MTLLNFRYKYAILKWILWNMVKLNTSLICLKLGKERDFFSEKWTGNACPTRKSVESLVEIATFFCNFNL